MEKVKKLMELLNQNVSGSNFFSIENELIEDIENKFPNMPSDLKNLFLTIGCGRIGESSYMIHFPTEPDEIYDEATATDLEGILIVGDDYMGNCEAYNAQNGWSFGYIGSEGIFEEYGPEFEGFVDFLIDWVSNESA